MEGNSKTMPDVNEVFPGKYLGAADLKNQEAACTIDYVEMEQFDDGGKKVMKPVVHFQGAGKAMVFNKTNALPHPNRWHRRHLRNRRRTRHQLSR